MPDNFQTQTPAGYLDNTVPIWQTEGITKEQAETVSIEINSAYIYLINQHSNSYSKLKDKLQEIHIVTTVANEEYKYDWQPVGNKAILRFKHNVTYLEAVHCIMKAVEEIN